MFFFNSTYNLLRKAHTYFDLYLKKHIKIIVRTHTKKFFIVEYLMPNHSINVNNFGC